MITKLTKEQEEAIIPYREYWIDRILRTEQSDDEIKENINKLYDLVGIERPKQVWIMDSMYGVQIACNFLKNWKENKLDLANISDNISANIYDNISANIYDNISANIRANISANIRDNIDANIRDNIRDNKLEYFGFSYQESGWLQWYIYQKFYFEQGLLLKDKYSQQLYAYVELVIDAWAVYYSKDIAIVSRKPVVRRENDRLHSDQLPAVYFKDGYELYYLDGVNFKKELWEKVVSKKMSFSEIMKIEISDQRTVALKYNPQAIIKEKAKLIHKDDRNNELYLVENSEINKLTNFPKMYFVKMLCPTGRVFVEGIDPAFAEKHPNATECQAELCGLVLSEYMSMTLES